MAWRDVWGVMLLIAVIGLQSSAVSIFALGVVARPTGGVATLRLRGGGGGGKRPTREKVGIPQGVVDLTYGV